jgi:hypothetical protein
MTDNTCMPAIIRLTVTHPQKADGPIEGYRFMWAFYLKGYRPSMHCQPGLIGRVEDEFKTSTARSGRTIELKRMDRYPYVYVCGVASGPQAERGVKNLHLPLRYAPGAIATRTTFNGYVFTATDAEALPIPEPLPPGFLGITDTAHLRCKNFRFAVSVFGPPKDAETEVRQ